MNPRQPTSSPDTGNIAPQAHRSGRRFQLLSLLARAWKSPRWLLMALSFGVIVYSFAVLLCVASMGDIGIRCVFSQTIKENVNPVTYLWTTDSPAGVRTRLGANDAPQAGDKLLRVDDHDIYLYTDYVALLRDLRSKIDQSVRVEWTHAGTRKQAVALVRLPPLGTYIWSFVWFVQEMIIFGIGALVFWKRPHDESARLFFWLCIMTVGAYMGGYHWSEIVVDPFLIYLFAAFGVFIPVVSL